MELKQGIFWKLFTEAEGDDDAADDPPDMAEDDAPADDSPPDMDDGGDMDDEDPPDIGGGGDGYDADDGFGDSAAGDDNGNKKEEITGLSNKVSAVLNERLYKQVLALLSQITVKKEMVRDNIDMIRTIDPDATGITEDLTRLEENIRDYSDHTFLNENYSSNMLFYTKCLNLFNLLCARFSERLSKGIKKVGTA